MTTRNSIGNEFEPKTVLEDLRNQHAQRRAQEQKSQSSVPPSGHSGEKNSTNDVGCGEFIG